MGRFGMPGNCSEIPNGSPGLFVGCCMLTRDDLLKPAQRRFANFRLSDGREFRVRSLTEKERSEWELASVDKRGQPQRDRLISARRRLILATLVDGNGDLLMKLDDEAALADLDGRTAEEIYKAAAAHCGISDSDVETLTKN